MRNSTDTLRDELAAILSGLIGGGRYGLKIRVPHAFGMSPESQPCVRDFVIRTQLVSSVLQTNLAPRNYIPFISSLCRFCHLRRHPSQQKIAINEIILLQLPFMSFLFGSQLSFRKKLLVISKLAAEHAFNLSAFACLYKVSGMIF